MTVRGDDSVFTRDVLPTILAAPDRKATPSSPIPTMKSETGKSERSLVRRPIPRRNLPVLPLGLVAVDILSLIVASMLVGFAWELGLMAVPAVLLFNALGGLYNSRLNLAVLDEAPSILGRGLAAITITCGLVSLRDWLSPVELGTGLLFTVAAYTLLDLCGRGAAYSLVRQIRIKGLTLHPTLVLGAGHVGNQVVSTLREHPEYGLKPVGFLETRNGPDAAQLQAPVLGGTGDLEAAIINFEVRHVFIAFGRFRDAELVEAIRICGRMGAEIFIVPRFFELNVATGSRVEDVFGIPCIRLRNFSRRSPALITKRVLDVVVSFVGLVLVSPIVLACAIAVRLETGPGVLFRQNRVGIDGQEFTLLKFRTLRPVDADESATRWNIAHDGRLGPIGRFLRRSSLDELPQLWNVLMGQMSLVGPRPERPHFVSEFTESFKGYSDRHRVPVGITGWAQIHGLRGDTSIEDRVRFDNQYIERWSLWQDIKIILRTIASLRRPGGG